MAIPIMNKNIFISSSLIPILENPDQLSSLSTQPFLRTPHYMWIVGTLTIEPTPSISRRIQSMLRSYPWLWL